MRLIVLGSESAGNCYLFDDGREVLMVECGIRFSEVKRATGFNVSRIVGCVISHEHKDHCKAVGDVLTSRIPVYCSEGTAEALGLGGNPLVRAMQRFVCVCVRSFRLLPFDVKHDAREPFGFLLSHPQMGTTLFATDTYYLRYKFKGLSNIMIECNYDGKLLRENSSKGDISLAQIKRTLRSHMSYETCVKTLRANDLSQVNNIVLIHLSSGNSNAERFRAGIERETCKNVVVADKGMVIDFNKEPY